MFIDIYYNYDTITITIPVPYKARGFIIFAKEVLKIVIEKRDIKGDFVERYRI